MKKSIITLATSLAVLAACSDGFDAVISNMQSPSNVAVERLSADEIKLTWTDNATAETGYVIMARRADEPANTLKQIGEVAANETSFTTTSLAEGYKYYIGVKAVNAKEQSRLTSVLFDMESYAGMGNVQVNELKSGTNCIYGNYTVLNSSKVSEWGLCWSADGTPTVDGYYISGPKQADDGKVFQVIPNTLLEYGVEYSVRAYAKTDGGVNYSPVYKASMTKEYPAITLEWTKVSTPGIPSAIEVYSTTSKLNGHNFEAWYAIADVKNSDVEFRVNVPASAQTIDDQAASFNGDCYIMVNGGYFYQERHTGLAVVNGKNEGSINEVRGSLLTSSPEYNEMYYATRGIFGVDAADQPRAFWAGTDGDSKTKYYTTPSPCVVGKNKYGKVGAKFPVEPTAWTPKFALSAGPLLLIDGKIPFDFTMTPNSTVDVDSYLTNYEIIAYDIFGTNVSPDRTAAGCTADGKIILFICDGRTAQSGGATLLELAQIMKGLGCVDAVNFDGGGSTGMMVGDKHINKAVIENNDGTQSPYNRAVVSTMGFFKK
ncbi:MAG: phosphodiester glycosidase family protein [Muribaculaceae bacterium]|nr:phosphodiester glycosidase family protein [Muribaculaceae bacterium]